MNNNKDYITSTFKINKELWKQFKAIAGTTGLKLNVFLIRLIADIVEYPEKYLPAILHRDYKND